MGSVSYLVVMDPLVVGDLETNAKKFRYIVLSWRLGFHNRNSNNQTSDKILKELALKGNKKSYLESNSSADFKGIMCERDLTLAKCLPPIFPLILCEPCSVTYN